MARERLSMRTIKEVLRLKFGCHLSNRKIAEICQIGRSTVQEYTFRATKAGLGWPLPEDLSQEELEQRLFSSSTAASSVRPLPDCLHIHNELRSHKAVNLTLFQLWVEYKEQYPNGYQYTQFCRYYHYWRNKLDYCMRQEHRGGEKLFVDYAKGLSIVDPNTGEWTNTQLFVAVWGASCYTYAQASLTQDLPCWTASHVTAFQFFGCAPHVLVPDCLKSAVTHACRYEPDINSTYADLAQHYGCAVLPARPRRPKDKAKVENGVLIAKRWILAVLRHRTFYSLGELNSAIAELLVLLNSRLMRKTKKSRKELFESLDLPNALALPDQPYELAQWRKARVNIDYHIGVESHNYSVPFRLLHESVDVRITANTMEVFYKGSRIAAHVRSYAKHAYTTLKEHMPEAHQKYLEWTPSRIIHWASKTGPATAQVVQKVMDNRAFPQLGYRACLGILRLGKSYGDLRLEAAAKRALQFNACSYKSIRAILVKGLDHLISKESDNQQQIILPIHENIRGGQYYN